MIALDWSESVSVPRKMKILTAQLTCAMGRSPGQVNITDQTDLTVPGDLLATRMKVALAKGEAVGAAEELPPSPCTKARPAGWC